MTMIKESSTRNANKKSAMLACPVTYVMDKIGGSWKPMIIYPLMGGPKRYSELRKAIPPITEKMLIQQLKQLEADGIISRRAKPVVPPYVVYSLTKSGMELIPVMQSMVVWAVKDSKKRAEDPHGILEGLI